MNERSTLNERRCKYVSNLVHIIGRFPPPIDGQTMATKRLADLLAPSHTVQQVNTSPEASEHVQAEVQFKLDRLKHYLRQRRGIKQAIQKDAQAPVLWASISPSQFGHLRDVATVLPAFHVNQPVYAVIHWGDFDRVFRQSMTAFTARRMVRQLRGFVFLNQQLADRCAAWIPEAKRFVIPNTIDEAVLCSEAEVAAKRASQKTRTTLRLLFLSNMIPSKGYLDVLYAVRLLHEQGVSVHADFIGHWESEAGEAEFSQIVDAAGLGEAVTHHGGVSDRAFIRQCYLDADIFLLPSYYPTEAQPLTIIEALNAGTPIITTRHSGIPDMVRHEQEAIFVPAQSPEAIAEAAKQLSDSSIWERYSEQALRRFQERFSPAAVRKKWQALLGTEA